MGFRSNTCPFNAASTLSRLLVTSELPLSDILLAHPDTLADKYLAQVGLSPSKASKEPRRYDHQEESHDYGHGRGQTDLLLIEG